MKQNPTPSWRRLAAACLLATLAGCITAPTPDNPHAPWTPPRDADRRDTTWEGLRQREADLSRPLALAELADLALRHNAATRRAWYEARAAAAQVDHAQGAFMPAVVASANAGLTGASASPASFDKQSATAGLGLQVNYLVLNFGGGRAAAVAQALQTVYAADFAFNQTIQDALLAVATAYYGHTSAQAGMVAAEAAVEDARTVLEAARARSTAGVGTELDVLQAQAAYDQALYARAAAKGQLEIARGTLAQAAGLPADAPLQTVAPTNELPGELAAAVVRGLVDGAITRRPDIAALRANLAARRAAVDVARAVSWPSLYLTGGLSGNGYEWMEGVVSQDADLAYNAGVSVSWTLFDGWQTESSIRTARYQAEAAQAQLEQAELAAGAEVWMRYQACVTARQKYTFSTAFLKSATAAHDTALAAYKAGLKSLLDLLTAESQLALARSQQVATRQEVLTALVQLAHATGAPGNAGGVPAERPAAPAKETVP